MMKMNDAWYKLCATMSVRDMCSVASLAGGSGQWAVGNISMNTNQFYHLITARPVQSSGQSE